MPAGRVTLLLLLVLGTGACGGEPNPAAKPADPQVATTLPQPLVRLISPPEWHAGQSIVVLGQNFVPPEQGSTFVRLQGTFIADSGEKSDVDWEVQTLHHNAGKVEFVFEAAYPPEGFGYTLGRFRGSATAVNRNDKDASPPSEVTPVEIRVGPSLIVWELQPEGENCRGKRVLATLTGETLKLEVEATGLTEPTTYLPLTFRVHFLNTAGESVEISEQRSAGTKHSFSIDPGELINQVLANTLLLNIDVTDGLGHKLERVLRVDIGREHHVAYDGNVRIVELYAPVPVSSCLPGGEYGRNVSYTGGQSESRSRSVAYSANIAIDLWIVNLNFGIGVTDTVSTDQSESLSLSGNILPLQFGVFYRQTQRLERIGQVIRRNSCGEEIVVGDARVTDWNWAPDLAVTHNGVCPPAPPSNLPPAEVFE